MNETDPQLLARYARDRSEDAFAELVRRHLDLVHSAALRQTRSPQLAEEVAQSVFTDLARNAGKLRPDTVLSAWLYQVTRRTAIDVVRREARRQLREQIATEMNAMNATADDWPHVEPLLDDAMAALDETDRTAILLRFFENKPLREVGQSLGVSDDAAQKRVTRAIERLREYFTKRGVTVGAGGLTALVSANAVQAAPFGLALTISTATATAIGTAVAATTTATTTAATATKAIAMTTLQKTVIGVTLAAAVGAGVYETHQASQLRDQVQSLQQQQAPLAGQIEQLQNERDEATHQLAALREENERLNRNTGELLKLRGEATRLRDQKNELERLREENQRLLTFQNALPAALTSQPDDLLEQRKRIAREKSIDGRNYATQLILFARENQDRLPTNWQQVAQYAQQFPVSGTNEFEMIYKKPFNLDHLGTNVHRTILVREYLAWPTPDGKWGKIYGFADGHSESVILDDGNFTAWEEQHTFSPEAFPD